MALPSRNENHQTQDRPSLIQLSRSTIRKRRLLGLSSVVASIGSIGATMSAGFLQIPLHQDGIVENLIPAACCYLVAGGLNLANFWLLPKYIEKVANKPSKNVNQAKDLVHSCHRKIQKAPETLHQDELSLLVHLPDHIREELPSKVQRGILQAQLKLIAADFKQSEKNFLERQLLNTNIFLKPEEFMKLESSPRTLEKIRNTILAHPKATYPNWLNANEAEAKKTFKGKEIKKKAALFAGANLATGAALFVAGITPPAPNLIELSKLTQLGALWGCFYNMAFLQVMGNSYKIEPEKEQNHLGTALDLAPSKASHLKLDLKKRLKQAVSGLSKKPELK